MNKKITWMSYKVLSIAFVVLVIIVLGIVAYVNFTKEKSYLSGEPKIIPNPGGEFIVGEPLPEGTSLEDLSRQMAEEEAAKAATSSEESATSTESAEIDRSSIELTVLNGSGKSGLAGVAAKELQVLNYKLKKTGNADKFDYVTSVLEYSAENLTIANQLKTDFLHPMELKESTEENTLTLIVGQDFVEKAQE